MVFNNVSLSFGPKCFGCSLIVRSMTTMKNIVCLGASQMPTRQCAESAFELLLLQLVANTTAKMAPDASVIALEKMVRKKISRRN
jgi:hypothetical protein